MPKPSSIELLASLTKENDVDFYAPFDGSFKDIITDTLGVTAGGVIFPNTDAISAKFNKAVQYAEAATNLVTNPSFETDESGWTTGVFYT